MERLGSNSCRTGGFICHCGRTASGYGRSKQLANGVHPKIASERLGHSKVGITLDLYSHVMPGMQEDAAAMVDAKLKAAAEKRRERLGSNPEAGRIGRTDQE
jgi:hypothetical protein